MTCTIQDTKYKVRNTKNNSERPVDALAVKKMNE